MLPCCLPPKKNGNRRRSQGHDGSQRHGPHGLPSGAFRTGQAGEEWTWLRHSHPKSFFFRTHCIDNTNDFIMMIPSFVDCVLVSFEKLVSVGSYWATSTIQ